MATKNAVEWKKANLPLGVSAELGKMFSDASELELLWEFLNMSDRKKLTMYDMQRLPWMRRYINQKYYPVLDRAIAFAFQPNAFMLKEWESASDKDKDWMHGILPSKFRAANEENYEKALEFVHAKLHQKVEIHNNSTPKFREFLETLVDGKYLEKFLNSVSNPVGRSKPQYNNRIPALENSNSNAQQTNGFVKPAEPTGDSKTDEYKYVPHYGGGHSNTPSVSGSITPPVQREAQAVIERQVLTSSTASSAQLPPLHPPHQTIRSNCSTTVWKCDSNVSSHVLEYARYVADATLDRRGFNCDCALHKTP